MGVSFSQPAEVKTKWFQDFESQLPSLEGKTIAITGCTTGIGLVVAKTSVKKNAKHVLLLNRPSSRADAAEQEVKRMLDTAKKDDGSPSSCTVVETIPCDLQVFDSVREAARLIESKYEAIDVLCNNAGTVRTSNEGAVSVDHRSKGVHRCDKLDMGW
jgi:NAD(P)-dependent dehydrogenase (short-subunit alcohol dehydrogenase family)